MASKPQVADILTFTRRHRHLPAHPADRGYHVAYRDGEVNYCPGCGRSHWYIGRATAECAFCATALPLLDTLSGEGLFWTRGRTA